MNRLFLWSTKNIKFKKLVWLVRFHEQHRVMNNYPVEMNSSLPVVCHNKGKFNLFMMCVDDTQSDLKGG